MIHATIIVGPDASDVTVDFDDESETLHVHITTSTGEPNHFRLNSWVMEIGSDDPWYTFRPVVELSYEDVITIPFAPEEDDGDAVGAMMGRNV